MGKAEQDRSRFLYSVLGSLIQRRLVGAVKNVENFNGYEALRQLLSNCQPQTRNRTMSLLQTIMAYPQFNMKVSLLRQILKLEEHLVQYERLSGSKLPTDMKAAVLLRAVGGQMKVRLNLTLNEGSSYQKIREAILAFDTATAKWNESAAISFTTTSPMTQAVDTGGWTVFRRAMARREKAKERTQRAKASRKRTKAKENPRCSQRKEMPKMARAKAKMESKAKAKESEEMCAGAVESWDTIREIVGVYAKLNHLPQPALQVQEILHRLLPRQRL